VDEIEPQPVGSSTNKIPSGATAYDADQDGFVNYVYFGDTTGTLWKVDVSSTNTLTGLFIISGRMKTRNNCPFIIPRP